LQGGPKFEVTPLDISCDYEQLNDIVTCHTEASASRNL